jgi:hypothetical protein
LLVRCSRSWYIAASREPSHRITIGGGTLREIKLNFGNLKTGKQLRCLGVESSGCLDAKTDDYHPFSRIGISSIDVLHNTSRVRVG